MKRNRSFAASSLIPGCLAVAVILMVGIPASIYFVDSSGSLQKDKIRVETENGVRVVKNPRAPLYGEITLELEKVRSIGDEKDENTAFYRG